MNIQGNVIRYGDHIDTDVIIPARYLNTFAKEDLAAHCMEDLDASFSEKVKTANIIVAGKNFGCGSSREHAPLAIQASGVKLVIAHSFARIFYRNAINIGLPIIECPSACETIKEGDSLSVSFDLGEIKNLTTGAIDTFPAFPPFLQSIISAGGLENAVRKGLLA